jgi:PKD repeat protein
VVKLLASSIMLMLIITGILSGCTSSENQPPMLTLLANPTSGYQPLNVTFQIEANDSDGSIQSYFIDFGDGTYSQETNQVSHIYPKAGTYIFFVTVTDDKGLKADASIAIIVNNNKPTASITTDLSSGKIPLTIQFAGTGSDTDGTIVSYVWDFTDGTTSTEQNPAHIFQSKGMFHPILIVTDDDGGMDIAFTTIDVIDTLPPTAIISASETCGVQPLTVFFNGMGTDSDGTIESYHWDFGDGTTSDSKNPTKVFKSSGNYTVTLTVIDDKGATGNDTIEITVLYVKSQYDLEPIADSTIWRSSQNYNYGRSAELTISKCLTSEEKIYFKFDLSSIPKGANVDYATLRLYCTNISNTVYMEENYTLIQTICIYGCSDTSWDEDEITFNNAPSYNTETPFDCEVINGNGSYWENNWVAWSYDTDIGKYVQNHLGEKITLVVAIPQYYDECSRRVEFRSADGAFLFGNSPPELEIKMVT